MGGTTKQSLRESLQNIFDPLEKVLTTPVTAALFGVTAIAPSVIVGGVQGYYMATTNIPLSTEALPILAKFWPALAVPGVSTGMWAAVSYVKRDDVLHDARIGAEVCYGAGILSMFLSYTVAKGLQRPF
jgi:hypothetical protein